MQTGGFGQMLSSPLAQAFATGIDYSRGVLQQGGNGLEAAKGGFTAGLGELALGKLNDAFSYAEESGARGLGQLDAMRLGMLPEWKRNEILAGREAWQQLLTHEMPQPVPNSITGANVVAPRIGFGMMGGR